MANPPAQDPIDEEPRQSSLDEQRTVLEEPRLSFISFVNRLLGGDRIASLTARVAKQAIKSDAREPLPEKIDRFDVISELGRGGFGVVYLAHDATLDRNVAIKVPHDWLAEDPAASARCLKEAQLASKVRHPGIVTIHDIRERDGRIDFVVQEHVEGTTLHDLMSRRHLSIRPAIELILKVAEAIAAAHALGVYHRDLKPANLIVDSQGGVHILDFGLAIDDETQLQLRGQVAGTAAYMSPEQLRGDAHHLDGRTDIWSLGVMFYELLTGRRPFRGNSQEAAEQVIKRAPAPPRQFHASIPKRVEDCCLKCLEKAVEDRFASANDLIEELRTILASETLPIGESPSAFAVEAEGIVDTKRLAIDKTKLNPNRKVLPRRSKWWVGLLMLLTSVGVLAAMSSAHFLMNRSTVGLSSDSSHKARGNDIDLLAAKPIPLVISGGPGVINAYTGEELTIHTNGPLVWLFKEPIPDLNYEIQVQFKQAGTWKGNVGVLYGVRPSKIAPGEYLGYLVEIYDHPVEDRPWKMDVSQVLIKQGEAVIKINSTIRGGILLKGEPQRVPTDIETLSLRVSKGHLKWVTFDGYSYIEPGMMTLSEFEPALKRAERHQVSVAEMTGQMGVKVMRANVTVTKAVVIPK